MKAVWGTIGCLQRVAAARARGRCFGSGTTPKDTMLKENKGETTPTKDTMLKETKETMLKDTKETKDTITRILPPGIKRPVTNYTDRGLLSSFATPQANITNLKAMERACALAADTLRHLQPYVQRGTTTLQLDTIAFEFITKNNAYPSPLHYKGYPASICTSVNNVMCHGIPNNRALADGDLVNIDVTVFLDGMHGDTSRTFLVSPQTGTSLAKALLQVTERAMMAGISVCRHGVSFSQIAIEIERVVADSRYPFTVSPDFCGHGIGSLFHAYPCISHTLQGATEGHMTAGMVFTVEPIVCHGSSEYRIWEDGWTAVSKDGGLSAQFEHTVLIEADGFRILTL